LWKRTDDLGLGQVLRLVKGVDLEVELMRPDYAAEAEPRTKLEDEVDEEEADNNEAEFRVVNAWRHAHAS
jgi:hypothetical protein